MLAPQRLRRPFTAFSLGLAAVSLVLVALSPSAALVGASAPSSNDGLFLHWDASVADSLRDTAGGTIEHGEQVGQWIDRASGVTASAAVTGYGPTAGPTYSTSGGQPVLTFDGTGAGLTTAPLALFTGPSSGLTVVAVIRPTEVNQQRFLLMHATGNCSLNFELGVSTGSGGDGNWGVHRGCGHAVVTPDGTLTVGTPVVLVTRVESSGTNPNQVSFRKNGSPVSRTTDTAGWVDAGSYPTASDRLRIAWRDDTGAGAQPNAFFQGDVSELLLFDRPLSDARLAEIESHLTAKWQAGAFVPSTPAQLSATATQTDATINWSPADGRGSTVTGYDVTVSAGPNLVDNCTLSGAPPATSCTVTGLSAGTTYLVSVSATNAFGVSAVATTTVTAASPTPLPVLLPLPETTTTAVTTTTSVPSPTTTAPPSTNAPAGTSPTTLPAGNPPTPPSAPAPLAAGLARASVEGVTVPVTVEQLTLDLWSLSGSDFRFELSLQGVGDAAANEQGSIRLVAGSRALTNGEGFGADTWVDVWLFSEPRLLARLPVDALGRFAGDITLPADLTPGTHTLQVEGLTSAGLRRSLSVGVLVEAVPAPSGGSLPSTGGMSIEAGALSVVILLLGVAAVVQSRRTNLKNFPR